MRQDKRKLIVMTFKPRGTPGGAEEPILQIHLVPRTVREGNPELKCTAQTTMNSDFPK